MSLHSTDLESEIRFYIPNAIRINPPLLDLSFARNLIILLLITKVF
jgi:hypothetical protein